MDYLWWRCTDDIPLPLACQVLAVAAKRQAKALVRLQKDVEKMAPRMDVARDRIAAWPSDQLVVFAEHPSLFYDLMTEQLMDQVRVGLCLLRWAIAAGDNCLLLN